MKSLGMMFGTLLCAATITVAAENPLTLWYSSDAGESFTDALPIGNGYMGGLIYGGVTKDVILLNESTVWNGYPGDNNKSGAANYIKDARDALFRGDYSTAESSSKKANRRFISAIPAKAASL